MTSSSWDATRIDSGDLSVPITFMLVGAKGCGFCFDSNRAISLTDPSPDGEDRFRARFYLETHGLTNGSPSPMNLALRYLNIEYEIDYLRLEVEQQPL